MKRKYLITANAGTGKSTVSKVLRDLGYGSYDLEEIPGMFRMYRKDTKQLYTDFDNGNPQMIENAEWLCNPQKLVEVFAKQKNDIAFYCGVGSNMQDIIPLFDKVVLLVVSKETLYKRLSNREGQNDMGGNEEGRQAVLGWKEWWENEMRKYPILEINAEKSPKEVAEEIIKVVGL